MTTTLLIVPAWSDQAGQCRIVARHGTPFKALQDYRENPDPWLEVGLMDSKGYVRCIVPGFASIKDDEPLVAGTSYYFD